jgi:ADP-ribosyl-[dinitrogen reductase] hydrolase
LLSYEVCIAETMLKAGDTDTNGAIVGGMIRAYYGKNALPKIMVEKVLNCDLNLGTKYDRPPKLSVHQQLTQRALN